MAYCAPNASARELARVTPADTALLIIDMQNFNCHPEGACLKRNPDQAQGFLARLSDMMPSIVRLQKLCRDAGVEVMYPVIGSLTQDGRDRSYDYKVSGFHCPFKSWDAQVIEQLAPQGDEIIIPKTSSSVFLSTNCDYLLRSMNKRHLIICGALTDQCVAHATMDACDLNYIVTLVPECCATYSQERHDNAVKSIKGYCRQRTVAEVERELS